MALFRRHSDTPLPPSARTYDWRSEPDIKFLTEQARKTREKIAAVKARYYDLKAELALTDEHLREAEAKHLTDECTLADVDAAKTTFEAKRQEVEAAYNALVEAERHLQVVEGGLKRKAWVAKQRAVASLQEAYADALRDLREALDRAWAANEEVRQVELHGSAQFPMAGDGFPPYGGLGDLHWEELMNGTPLLAYTGMNPTKLTEWRKDAKAWLDHYEKAQAAAEKAAREAAAANETPQGEGH